MAVPSRAFMQFPVNGCVGAAESAPGFAKLAEHAQFSPGLCSFAGVFAAQFLKSSSATFGILRYQAWVLQNGSEQLQLRGQE